MTTRFMPTRPRLIPVSTVVFTAMLLSCQWSENRYLRRTVVREEVVGRWQGTPFGMESLEYAGYKTHLNAAEHRIVLRSDGICQAETLLDPTGPSPSGTSTWLTATVPCRWQLNSDGQHQTLDLSLSVPSRGEQRLSLYFDEQGGTLVLWQFAGDPDAWKYMEFKKSA